MLGSGCGRTAGPQSSVSLATNYGAINASGLLLRLFGRCHSRSINVTLGEFPLAAEAPRQFMLHGSSQRRRLRAMLRQTSYRDAGPALLVREHLLEHLQQANLYEMRIKAALKAPL